MSKRERKPAPMRTEVAPAASSCGGSNPQAPAAPTSSRQVACHSGEVGPDGKLVKFKDAPAHFRPSLTPHQMLAKGMHGGIYFNPKGGKPGVKYPRSKYPNGIPGVTISEFPPEWFKGVPKELYQSRRYSTTHNMHKVKSGLDQAGWESSGWINACDPRGWTQWYFRFYAGRRLAGGEDERQIGRWNGVCGEKGRWKQNLIAKCLRDGKSHDDASVSPVVRQTLLHWAYELTEADFKHGAKRVKTHGATYIPREQLSGVVTGGKGKATVKEEEAEVKQEAEAKAAEDAEGRASRAKRRADGDAAPRPAKQPRAAAEPKRKAAAKKVASPPPLSAYERQRDVTKARNQSKLVELGLA